MRMQSSVVVDPDAEDEAKSIGGSAAAAPVVGGRVPSIEPAVAAVEVAGAVSSGSMP
jgi:hypothetical protein